MRLYSPQYLVCADQFNIRTHMTSLEQVRRVPAWRDQLARVVLELPEDLAAYKGFLDYREPAMAWLLAGEGAA